MWVEFILAVALTILYIAFWAWHSQGAGKLTQAEIDQYLAIIEKLPLPEKGVQAFTSRLRPWAEADARYEKSLLWLWLSHASYPTFIGVPQARNLIDMQPERTWENMTVVRYPSRRMFLKLISSPAYAPLAAYKFIAVELDLVPVSGGVMVPDLRWLVGGGFAIIFLLFVCIRGILFG